MANQQGNRTWISFVFAKFRDFVFPTLLFCLFFRLISFFWSDSLILSFSTRNAFPFIEDYLYSIDKSQGTWKIGHDNVLCWQKQEIICQEIRCFTNKCNYNRDCGLTICCATTHIQNNLELNNKNHFRSEIVMSVRPLNFLRTSPPFLLQTPTPPPPPHCEIVMNVWPSTFLPTPTPSFFRPHPTRLTSPCPKVLMSGRRFESAMPWTGRCVMEIRKKTSLCSHC